MLSFLREFIRTPQATHTVLLVAENSLEAPRSYQLRSAGVLAGLLACMLVPGLLLVALLVLTPLRELIPGYTADDVRREALQHTTRLAALEDSLRLQQEYAELLRSLLMGQPTSALPGDTSRRALPDADTVLPTLLPPEDVLPLSGVEASPVAAVLTSEGPYPASLRWPVLPPADGFITRSFDPRTGHYAIDIALQQGSPVRAIGDGFVVFADWTHEGGHVLAVQHADGFISLYKHNQRLLKQVGDRVRMRETICLSGNSGEITTGPHLHFELWHNGLAQNPRAFLIGL
jgi:murein DD-endopeptidase MepM/ murein hydrolase activator NlpD